MAPRLDDLIREHAERLDQLAGPVDLTDVTSAPRSDTTNVALEPTWTQPEGRHRWPIIAVAAAAVVAVAAGGLMVATRTDPAKEVPADQPPTLAPTTNLGPRDIGEFEGTGPGVTYIVPDGWENTGFGVFKRDDPRIGMNLVGADDYFYTSSCHTTSGVGAHPVGPTVDHLVAAWAKLPGVDATAARDVTIDRFDGKQIEFAVPDRIEGDGCSGMYYRCSWIELNDWPFRCDNLMSDADSPVEAPGISPNTHQKISILDVDGARVMIMARSLPNTSRQDRATLDEIVASIDFSM